MNNHLLPVVMALVFLCLAKPCFAKKDVRIALLVANQKGWNQDPTLHYVLSGDLRPMAKTLRSLGFQIFAILPNQRPATLRRVLSRLKRRLQRSPHVTTFFFYYSGHADKHHFHMGKRGKKPFSYQELIRFFAGIRVRRRFAVIDACFSGEIIRQFGSLKQFSTLREKNYLKSKGIEPKLVISDLRKYLPDQGNQTRGLQIISSSRHLSFESTRRKGSVFTYHFLQGLRGDADLDKDGKIDLNELFLYTKPRVRKETGQSPQQWLFREGSETYGFAPAYRSMLEIDAQITGQLQISVGGFVWRWHKRLRKPLRLAVGTGQGEIWLRSRHQCYHSQLFFPDQGQVSLLASQMSSVACSVSILRSKSDIQLPTQIAPVLEPGHAWDLSIQSGPQFSSGFLQAGGDLAVGGSLGLRHRIFALSIDLNVASTSFSQTSHTHLSIALRGELGYRRIWRFFDLFLGGYLSLGLLFQDLNQAPAPGFLAHTGLTTNVAFIINPRWALTLALDAGIVPTVFNALPRFFFLGSIRAGLRISL